MKYKRGSYNGLPGCASRMPTNISITSAYDHVDIPCNILAADVAHQGKNMELYTEEIGHRLNKLEHLVATKDSDPSE